MIGRNSDININGGGITKTLDYYADIAAIFSTDFVGTRCCQAIAITAKTTLAIESAPLRL